MVDSEEGDWEGKERKKKESRIEFDPFLPQSLSLLEPHSLLASSLPVPSPSSSLSSSSSSLLFSVSPAAEEASFSVLFTTQVVTFALMITVVVSKASASSLLSELKFPSSAGNSLMKERNTPCVGVKSFLSLSSLHGVPLLLLFLTLCDASS